MKKITLLLACFICFAGTMNAQSIGNSFADQNTEYDSVTVQDLLDRLAAVGDYTGNVTDFFSTSELRLLNVHNNGIDNLAPVVITQSNTQTIEPGADIACASPTSFRDNNMFRSFDLDDDHGLPNGVIVTDVEFAIGVITTPTGFPIVVNVYSTPEGAFPGGTLTLQGTGVYNATNADAATIVTVPVAATMPAGEDMVVELVLTDDGTDTNFMRFGCNNDGETGDSYIQAVDCGAATPQTFASLGLSQGMVMNVLGDDAVGGGGVTPIVYGIDNTVAQLVSFDAADPTVMTQLGASPAAGFENAGAIDPNDVDTAYVLDNGGAFYSVDVTTGTYTSLGTIAAPAPETWAGMEFDPTTGNLYAISTDVATSTLSMIDPVAMTATTIGVTGMAGGISLMIDGAGTAYSHDIVDDNFYFVDLVTGAATPLGPLGFNANFGQGGTYNPADDTVYLSAYNGDAGVSEWRSVDLSNGSTTVIGLFDGTGSDQVAWSSAIGDPVIGIAENALEGFAFSPNPTSDVLSLKSVNNIESVAMYNLLGQQVLSTTVDATSSELDLSSLVTGTYIMKVTVDGQSGTYKVLKN